MAEHGTTVLRVFPDYSADPVWADDGMVDLDSLPISEGLRTDLRAWAREWERLIGVRESRFRIVDKAAYAAWVRLGRVLAARLRTELGSGFEVRFGA